MTEQPDVAGAVLALDQAMIALAVAKSTLLGETSMPLAPYGSAKHGVFGARSAAEVAKGVGRCRAEEGRDLDWWMCTMPAEHYGEHVAQDEDGNVLHTWPGEPVPRLHEPTGHLPQHTHGEPGCTYCGKDHAAVTR